MRDNATFYMQKKAHGRVSIFTCFSLLAVYKILLNITYSSIVSKRWMYIGLYEGKYTTITFITSIIGLIIASAVFSVLSNKNTFSHIVVELLVLISFIPGIVLYQNINESFLRIHFLYWTVFFVLYLSSSYIKIEKISTFRLKEIIRPLSILIFLFIFMIWGVYSHFHIQLDLIEVYEVRREAANYGMPRLFYYVFGSLQLCIPLLAVYAINEGESLTAAILLAAQTLAFFSQGSKTVIFSIVLAVILYFILSNWDMPTEYIWLYLFILIVLGSVLEVWLCKNYSLVDYFLRRILYLPNLLNQCYYDFFSANPPDFFRSSFLRHFGMQSIYAGEGIQHMIGRLYFNAPEMYSNNGLLSDAYMNLGDIGLFIMPILDVVFLFIIDSCSGALDRRYLVSTSLFFTIVLAGSSLLSSLLSHGFILLALLFTGIEESGQEAR